MTGSADALAHADSGGAIRFTPDMPVVRGIDVLDPANKGHISRFRDDKWCLHRTSRNLNTHPTVNFSRAPPKFRDALKRVVYVALNEETHLDALEGGPTMARPRVAPTTIQRYYMDSWRPLARWLDSEKKSSLRAADEDMLLAYRRYVTSQPTQRRYKEGQLFGVVRLWLYAPYLYPEDQIAHPPWDDEAVAAMLKGDLGPRDSKIENATVPIHPETAAGIITAALHVVNDLSESILDAVKEQRAIAAVADKRHGRHQIRVWKQYLDDLREKGEPLPGRLRGGRLEVATQYIAGRLGMNRGMAHRYAPQRYPPGKGIPVRLGAPLDTAIEGRIQGKRWSETVDFYRIGSWIRLLTTACYIVVAYLSGMRPDECSALKRGCCSKADPEDELMGYEIQGRVFKVTGPDGLYVEGGQERDHPWFVIDPVARAVSVMERLHPYERLFPVTAFAPNRPDRVDSTPGPGKLHRAIAQFIAWWNETAEANGWTVIPPEPERPDGSVPRITVSRFRRTVAWFVYRLPGGLIALGVQYGHIDLGQTARYGSRVQSGLSEIVEERAFALRDFLDARSSELKAGAGVSGPAADRLLSGLMEYDERWAGPLRVLDEHDFQDMLRNPRTHIYDSPHQFVTCDYNAILAECRSENDRGSGGATGPDPQRCDPQCANAAHIDENIRAMERYREQLRAENASSFPPEPLKRRNEQLIASYTKIIDRHWRDRIFLRPEVT